MRDQLTINTIGNTQINKIPQETIPTWTNSSLNSFGDNEPFVHIAYQQG